MTQKQPIIAIKHTFNQNSDEPLIQIPIKLNLKTEHFH